MAKVLIKNGGATIEAELTVKELRELAGLNGHGHIESGRTTVHAESPSESLPTEMRIGAFFGQLSQQAKGFLGVVKSAGRDGISADRLVSQLALSSRYQIGGITQSISKVAKRLDINRRELYRKEAPSINGVRTVVFKPGKFLEYIK